MKIKNNILMMTLFVLNVDSKQKLIYLSQYGNIQELQYLDNHDEKFENIYPFLPIGWFNYSHCKALYNAVKNLKQGNVLEIGGFVGRSTACMCLGLNNNCDFSTIDMHFANENEFLEFYSKIHGPSIKVPDLYSNIYDKNLSTYDLQLQNLKKLNFENFKSYIGDFKSYFLNNKYDLLFADVCHDESEIELNIYAIKNMLKSGSILLIDDIYPKYFELILNKIEFSSAVIISPCLFVGIVK
jgi:hypothetical protein